MTRIAGVFARAGQSLPGVDAASWDAEARTAEAHLRGPVPTPDPDLATAVRRIFLSRRSHVRSVAFCSVPGDATTDLAWRAAVRLADESGRTVAFVADAATARTAVYQPSGRGAVVAIDRAACDAVGLWREGDFVIVDTTALAAHEIGPLARAADGVIVVLAENETRISEAERLLEALRASGARPIGAILTTGA